MAPARQGLLVVLSGPSGVGKGTVVNHAMSHPGEVAARLRRSISVTTRGPRPGEVEGVDYFFHSPEEFARMAHAGELLEWATYLDRGYGTPREWVDQQLAEGYDVVLEIEVKGALLVRSRRPDAVLIYMMPPSWEELRQRLAGRGTDDEETQRRRLAVVEDEMKMVPSYDYVIENGTVAAAAHRFLAILQAEHCRVGRWRVRSG